ncbi:MAG: hypothetical protein ACQEXX_01385 [Bacillota bacterium]
MRQTEEELILIKRYLELPYLLDVIEVDKNKVEQSDMITKKVVVRYFDYLQSQVTRTMHNQKQALKSRDIRIIEQERLDDRLIAKYMVRGYQHQMTLLWSKVKTDVMVMLAAYMKLDITDT